MRTYTMPVRIDQIGHVHPIVSDEARQAAQRMMKHAERVARLWRAAPDDE